MFDPTIARFTSEDPMGFDAGDPNLYRYTGNDPTNATDPSGQYILTDSEAQAEAICVYINHLTGVFLNNPHPIKIPAGQPGAGKWMIQAVFAGDPRAGIPADPRFAPLATHWDNNSNAPRIEDNPQQGIDWTTRWHRHLLLGAVLSTSGINVYIPTSADVIKKWGDNDEGIKAWLILPTDDTAERNAAARKQAQQAGKPEPAVIPFLNIGSWAGADLQAPIPTGDPIHMSLSNLARTAASYGTTTGNAFEMFFFAGTGEQTIIDLNVAGLGKVRVSDNAIEALVKYGKTQPLGPVPLAQRHYYETPIFPGDEVIHDLTKDAKDGDIAKAVNAAKEAHKLGRKIVIVGWSRGAVRAIRMAAELSPDVPVEYLGLIDPVSTAYTGFEGDWANVYPNVKRLYYSYKDTKWLEEKGAWYDKITDLNGGPLQNAGFTWELRESQIRKNEFPGNHMEKSAGTIQKMQLDAREHGIPLPIP
jgi:hypothetical protein